VEGSAKRGGGGVYSVGVLGEENSAVRTRGSESPRCDPFKTILTFNRAGTTNTKPSSRDDQKEVLVR